MSIMLSDPKVGSAIYVRREHRLRFDLWKGDVRVRGSVWRDGITVARGMASVPATPREAVFVRRALRKLPKLPEEFRAVVDA